MRFSCVHSFADCHIRQSLEELVPFQNNTLNLLMDFQISFGGGEEKMMTFTTGTVLFILFQPPQGGTPYISYIGMCHPKGYGEEKMMTFTTGTVLFILFQPPQGGTPYISYIGMCHPKGYGF